MRIALFFVLFLAGCVSTPEKISTGPSIVPSISNDLQAAARNLDQAIAIGVLQPNDPAAACVHGVLKQAGLEGPPGQSFTPESAGLASAGSIAYIIAVQARGAGGLQLPTDCQGLIGKLVIDGARDARKFLPLIR